MQESNKAVIDVLHAEVHRITKYFVPSFNSYLEMEINKRKLVEVTQTELKHFRRFMGYTVTSSYVVM
jgi:hypothetical protein